MLWLIFDYLGTFAFAISGTMVGMQKRMDIFGIFVLALATAVGGGVIRDTLVGNTPPIALKNAAYVWLSLLAVIVILVLSHRTRRTALRHKWATRLYYLADTIGLASFTVTGAVIAITADPRAQFLLPMTLGVITACGGGIIRDICAMRIPVVFRSEFYAAAALTGSFVFCIVRLLANLTWAIPFSFLTVFALRLLAIIYRWNLPRSFYR